MRREGEEGRGGEKGRKGGEERRGGRKGRKEGREEEGEEGSLYASNFNGLNELTRRQMRQSSHKKSTS